MQRVAQGTPQNVQKYLYRTVAYIGGTTVMKNNFNREVLQYFDASYGYPLSPEEAEIYARQAIRFGAWESLIRAIDSMTVTQNKKTVGNIGLLVRQSSVVIVLLKQQHNKFIENWLRLVMTIITF